MIKLKLTLNQFEALYELLNAMEIDTDNPGDAPLVEILDMLNDVDAGWVVMYTYPDSQRLVIEITNVFNLFPTQIVQYAQVWAWAL